MNRIIVLLLPALLLSACFDKLDLSGICRPGDPACAELDYDSDGVINALDNCPSIPNSNQADGDQDGTGDACEDLVIVDPDSCTGDRCLTFEHFEVYSDDNSDGVINKGETVRIKVYLKNQSSRRIGDLSGSLSSSDGLVSISEPGVANWGSLDGGREDYGNVQGGYSYSFEFSVDPGAPAGHQIPFSLAMSDSAGNNWSLSFNAVVDVLDAGLLVGRVEIYSDDNSDGAINKGETVRIKVFLRNTGQSDILDLSAVVSSSDQYVTLSYPDSANWGNLVAAEEDYGNISGGYSYSYEFTVDPATPDDHLMEFSLAATDQHQNTWTLPFSLTVVDLAARLEVSRVEIYSDDNSDKAINKGETVRLKVFLRNTGESDILDLSALLSTNDPYVSVSYPDSANWGNLVSGEEDYGNISGGYSYSFQIEVDPATPDDHVIQFGLAAADEHDNTWQLSFQQTVQDLAAQLVFSRVEIYSDDNSNDLAEAGETVRIKVYLRNTGTSDALDVGAVLSAGDSLSTISYPDSAGFGNMVAGEEDYGNISGGYSYSYQLDVSAQATAGQNMNFSLAISDEFSNTWSDSFQIQVY